MNRTVLIVAAESGLLPNLKVGGIADVTGDLAQALCRKGWQVIVMTPGYGLYSNRAVAEEDRVRVRFGHRDIVASVLPVDPTHDGNDKPSYNSTSSPASFVVEHELLQAETAGQIYVHDSNGPFATDANRFMLFCTIAAKWASQRDDIDVLHLHDWHAAGVALLRTLHPDYASLQKLRTVFTIHNLALQGVRPLRADHSSLQSWFPNLEPHPAMTDPRWPECINLMRTGITLSDVVNTVSPTYAGEIQYPNDADAGYHGGEGLEEDLSDCAATSRLTGILNGCEYDTAVNVDCRSLVDVLSDEVLALMGRDRHVRSSHVLALHNLGVLKRRRRRITFVTSVGRIVEQKLGLLTQTMAGQSVLDHVLHAMGDDGAMLILGTGDPDLENVITEHVGRHRNLIYIAGFSQKASELLYSCGHLFLMPSVFEPCGISQMLAMRNGQPCIVNAVGGLKDTIEPGVTGWSFHGKGDERATMLLDTFTEAFTMAKGRTPEYQQICEAAKRQRFTWDHAADLYIALYDGSATP